MKVSAILFFAAFAYCLLPIAITHAHPVEFHADETDYLPSHTEEIAPYENSAAEPSEGALSRFQGLNIFSSLLESFEAFFSKIKRVLELREWNIGSTPNSSAAQYPEIKKILALSDSGKQSEIYRQLIVRVGVIEAQEALYRAGLPFTGETHLIQHVAGSYLYETEGAQGISKCTSYFLAACYHEFIIYLLSREGPEALPEAMAECWKSGPSVASQCAHGMGHGFLAWYGYKNLDRALEGCDALAKESQNFPSLNCHEGAFMENQWALHPGATKEDQWLSDTDPYYPCDDPRIKDEWLSGCWLNQGSVMYQHFGDNIAKTAEACAGVTESQYQELCFNSLSRQIHPLTKSEFQPALSMCGELGAWSDYCLKTIAVADFSIGGRDLPYRICETISGDEKEKCYLQLSGMISMYAKNQEELESFCAPIADETYRTQCLRIKQF